MLAEELLINHNTPTREAINALIKGGKKTIFIIDDNGHFIGLFTNGDMRKALLSNDDLSLPVEHFCNQNPLVFESKQAALSYSKANRLIVYPIVKNNVLIEAIYEDDSCLCNHLSNELNNVPLVMMAGGKGTRLYPYTQILPKALIPIGEKTISERIIDSFVKYGVKKVYFILNHKANMIISYYNDLEKSYDVHFKKEEKFLGTGGGLFLLKDELKSTFILSNCDILIEDDLSCAYQTHIKNKNIVTMVCSSKNFSIPYGVVKTTNTGDFLKSEEKPQFDFLINTGVYIVEPDIFQFLDDNTFIGMPTLIQKCADNGMKVGIFPVGDKSWFDMGEFDTMNQMLEHLNVKKQ